MPHGNLRKFYPDGGLASETSYKLGKKTGDHVSYHSNNQVESKGKFLKDQEIGVWEYFDSSGKPVKKVTFNRGKVEKEELLD